ncbi:protein DMP2-like [Phragmites australis]|uniref:protein DMP2-like n=1 Tax=Phragmites australis TaxID=29695 RepID=UPI002D795D4C|nr:protein DMP2-like [Phragmites australis]
MDPNAMHIQMPTTTKASSSQEDTKPRPINVATATPPADKTLSSASDLLKLLPTGTVLAFQALAPSFSNHGVCHAVNRYLVLALITACAVSCVLLSFTDSLVGCDGKLYHGVATFWGFYPFNFTGTRAEREATFKDLSRFRITALDFVHAFFSALVFLAVALADASIQGCLFPDSGQDVRELLVNLPLGAGFLSSIVFMIFPTTRRSIGYTDMAPHAQ